MFVLTVAMQHANREQLTNFLEDFFASSGYFLYIYRDDVEGDADAEFEDSCDDDSGDV